MSNAKRSRERAQRSASMAGYQITLAAEDTGSRPMDGLAALRHPTAKRRDYGALSDAELDAILAEPETKGA